MELGFLSRNFAAGDLIVLADLVGEGLVVRLALAVSRREPVDLAVVRAAAGLALAGLGVLLADGLGFLVDLATDGAGRALVFTAHSVSE